MEYGTRLREIRKAKGFSMYKLHKESGLSQGHISDLEKCINQQLTVQTNLCVAGFRTLPEDKADLALQMIKALNR